MKESRRSLEPGFEHLGESTSRTASSGSSLEEFELYGFRMFDRSVLIGEELHLESQHWQGF